MNYKVVKNSYGVVVAWGPNDEHYAPTIAAGCTLELSDTPPDAPAKTKAQKIADLLAPYKLERISIQMVIGMAELRADLVALQTNGATTREADLANSFTRNTAYRVARTLENACLAIEAAS